MQDQQHQGENSPRIAAVVRVAGDEQGISTALGSVAWANDRMVVGLGSNEEAVLGECAAHGAVMVDAEDLPAETARREVDWVLLIEGYEEVPQALAREIRAAARVGGYGASPVAYRIKRRVQFFGRTLRSRPWTAPRFVRFARRDAVSWGPGSLCEDSLSVEGHVECLHTPLLAAPCVTLGQYVSRMNVLSDAAARAQYRAKGPVRWRDLVAEPAVRGLRILPEAALRDGVAGVILAVLEVYATIVTCAKRWELEHPEGPLASV